MASEYYFLGYLDNISTSESNKAPEPMRHELLINGGAQKVSFTTVAQQRRQLCLRRDAPDKIQSC